MKKVRITAFAFLVLAGFSGWGLSVFLAPPLAAAEEKPSPELIAKGKEIFYNTKKYLGTKFACILCHQKEKAIKKSKALGLGDKLPDVINLHITEKAKGKPIARDSEEMKALEAYILHEHSI